MTDSSSTFAYHRHLSDIAARDVEYVEVKDRQYSSSWKQRGGPGAFFTVARPWDRFESISRRAGDRPAQPSGMTSVGSYDVFGIVEYEGLAGPDGSLIACIRDLRRYMLLLEAELTERAIRATTTVSAIVSISDADAERLKKLVRKPFRGSLSVEVGEEFRPLNPDSSELAENCAGCGWPIVGEEQQNMRDIEGGQYHGACATVRDSRRRVPRPMVEMPVSPIEPVGDPSGRLQAESDEQMRAGTPEDGGHHERQNVIGPWTISKEYAGFSLASGETTFNAFTTLYQSPRGELRPLEETLTKEQVDVIRAAVINPWCEGHQLLKSALELYCAVGSPEKLYVLDIARCPPSERVMFSHLKAEVNDVELFQLPNWKHGLYRWCNDENKHRIAPEHEAWTHWPEEV